MAFRRRDKPPRIRDSVAGVSRKLEQLIDGVLDYGLDMAIVSWDPPTIRWEIADREIEETEKRGVMAILAKLLFRK